MPDTRFEVVYTASLCSSCHIKLTHIRDLLREVCATLPDAQWQERRLTTKEEISTFSACAASSELSWPAVLVNGKLLSAGTIPSLADIHMAVGDGAVSDIEDNT